MKNVELFRGAWLEDLHDVKTAPNQCLKDYLKSETHKFELESSSKVSNPLIRFFVPSEINECVVHDVLRFSKGAFQSIDKQLDKNISKNISWGIIKSYYSSFFSAHALMRLCGLYYSYFDLDLVNNVNSVSPKRAFNLSTGVYLIKVDQSLNQLSLTPLGKKSTHDGLWSQFNDFIDDLTTLLTKEYESAANDFVDQWSTVASILGANNAGSSFMTIFRNDVNYLNSLKYWYPFQGIGTGTFGRFERNKNKWRQSSESVQFGNKEDPGLDEFQSVVRFLVSLAKESTLELERVCPVKSGFYTRLINSAYIPLAHENGEL